MKRMYVILATHLKTSTPKQGPQRLSIVLAQVKEINISENLLKSVKS